jgi:trehalose synthase
MPRLTLHHRFRILSSITVLCIVIACYQTGFAQDSPNYIEFLEQRSMLFEADQVAATISGDGVQWRQHYEDPEPSQFVQSASVWVLYYPGSVITKPDQSVLGLWADKQFWDTMKDVGITAIHTNPIQRAGGIQGTDYTQTTDGWFDRIGLEIDPAFGTDDEYKQMVKVAGEDGAIVGSDLVPLHTGLGADFLLAERAYKDYPGMYTMVEIPSSLWNLLPNVPNPPGHELVSVDAAVQLRKMGFIPGTIHSADADPSAASWSGWSATPEVVGVDGIKRRWVYLHIFKPSQPAMNWLDPSYAGPRTQYGDAAHHIVDRGTKFLRLDAVPFTAIDPNANDTMAQTYLQPLSVDNANELAYIARKLGGFTYQELYIPLEQLKMFTQHGPDLSYDFFTRAQVLHPLITGDVLPLRLAHSVLLQVGVQAGTLVHDMQNHDEITYQLIDLDSRQDLVLDDQHYNGPQLKEQILNEMRSTVGAAPFNKLYRPQQDGIATTFAGFVASAFHIDPYHATPDQVALIRQGHLLIAHANAMQPGVFGISAWDLVGALPIPPDQVSNFVNSGSAGDWRWINRGAVDLLGVNSSATKSTVMEIPTAQALYGPVPQQLADPNSFASQIKKMLAARKQFQIDQGTMNAVPPTGNKGVCVLEMTLPNGDFAITVLNYGTSSASIQVDLTQIPPGIPAGQVAGQTALDIVADQNAGTVSDSGSLAIDIGAISGRTLVVHRQGMAAATPAMATTTPQPAPTPTPTVGSDKPSTIRSTSEPRSAAKSRRIEFHRVLGIE